MKYIRDILNSPLSENDQKQLDCFRCRKLDAIGPSILELAWDTVKAKLTQEELTQYPPSGILSYSYIYHDLLLSGLCRLKREQKTEWEPRPIDGYELDIVSQQIARFRRTSKEDGNFEALKNVKLDHNLVLIPQYAGEYCFQTLKNATQFPWAKRSNASKVEIYSYDTFCSVWQQLFKADIIDWYEFEKNTGFNFTLFLLSQCHPKRKIVSHISKNYRDSILIQRHREIISRYKRRHCYDRIKNELEQISMLPPTKTMGLVYYRFQVFRDCISNYSNGGSYLAHIPAASRFAYLDTVPMIKYYEIIEKKFLDWVVRYVAEENDTSEEVANKSQLFLVNEFHRCTGNPRAYLFDFLPLSHFSAIKHKTTNRSNPNKYFVGLHEYIYLICSKNRYGQ